MLSMQTIRERTAEVRQACADRQMDVPIDTILERDTTYRMLLSEVETQRAARNAAAFAASWAAATTRAELGRDLRPAELAAVKQGVAAITATPSVVRSQKK